MSDWVLLIPLGLTVAFTTIPIVTTIVVLLNADSAAPGWRITISYAAALALVVAIFALALHAIRLPKLGDRGLIGWVEVVVGVLLFGLGVFQFVRTRTGPPRPSKLISGLRNLTPRASILLGASLAVHPENLLISAAAATRIRHADAELLIAAAMVVWFAVLGVSTVAGVTLAYAGARTRMRPALVRFQGWLERDAAVLMAVVVALIGVLLVLIGGGMLGWGIGIHV